MASAIGPKMTGALVQPMARPGVELIAGAVRDDTFGPLVLFGMGGITAELLGDRGVRVAPLSDLEAGELVHSLRCAPLLTGYRGAEPVDVDALADLLVRLSLLTRGRARDPRARSEPGDRERRRRGGRRRPGAGRSGPADRFAADNARRLSPPRPA